MAVTSLILGTGLSNIYGKFAVNPSDPENALIAYKQQEYNVGAIQVLYFLPLVRSLKWLLSSSKESRGRALNPLQGAGHIKTPARGRPQAGPAASLPVKEVPTVLAIGL